MQVATPPSPSPVEPADGSDRQLCFDAALDQVVVQKQCLRDAMARLYEESVKLRASISLGFSGQHSKPQEVCSGGDDLLSRLAPREVEVLRLIAEGFSTKEIAVQLHISFKTAVCYRTRLLKKLEVHESASLVRLAIRMGLLSA